MANASSVSLRLNTAQIESIHGAFECVRRGFIAGGLGKNREFIGECTRFSDTVSEEMQKLLFDPQTSGGLLVAVQPEFSQEARIRLSDAGCSASQVGEVVKKTSPLIEVS
jgi:selenide,water dikinase